MQAASDSFAASACRAASDLYELACCSLVFPMLLLIHRMNSDFGLSVGFWDLRISDSGMNFNPNQYSSRVRILTSCFGFE